MSADAATAESVGAPSAGIFSAEHRRLTAAIVSMVLLIAFEAQAVATAMPRAVTELNGLGLYAWAFSGFLVTSLFAMVLSGQWCDQLGPRRPVLWGVGVFVGGMAIAGTAGSMVPFVLGRAVQGFGAGLTVVALYVLVARAYDSALRPRVFSALSAAWVLPSIVGPALAGAVADHATWRLVFLGLVPLAVPPLVLVRSALRQHGGAARDIAPARRGRKRLALTAAVGAGLLQYAGDHLGPVGLVLGAGAVVLLAVATPRLLPPGTLRFRRGLPSVVAMRGVLAGSFIGAEAFIPLLLVKERELSSTLAGLVLTGGALGWAVGSWYQGRPAMRTPRSRLVGIGSGMVALGIASVAAVLLPSVPVAVAVAAWTLGAGGMGMAMSSISVLVFELSEPAEQGSNAASLQFADALACTVALGVAGSVYAYGHEHAQQSAAFVVILALAALLASTGAALGRRVALSPGR